MIAFVYSLYNSIATFAFEKKSFGFEDLIFFLFQLQTHDHSMRACACWLISVCDFYFYLLSKSTIINKHVLYSV